MGTMRQDTIVVTGFQEDAVEAAREAAERIFHKPPDPIFRDRTIAPVTDVYVTKVNGYGSFAVLPDGSKEGWGHSDAGDEAREEFIEWLCEARSNKHMWLEWVHVRFGGDEPGEGREPEVMVQGTTLHGDFE